jgi:hypothetical protein
MKLSITPVALAVTMALGAAVAQAQTPTYGTTSPADGGANDGLYLAVWDNSTKATDLIDLTSVYSQITAASGTLSTPTPGSNGWSTVSNFDGFASVDQLNLGTISNFSSIFPTSSQSAATQYGVFSANNGGTGVAATLAVGSTPNVAEAGVKTLATSILGESSNWNSASNTSPLSDTTGTPSFSIPGQGALGGGDLGIPGDSFSAQVGTAANFYNYVTSGRPATLTTTEYGYNGEAGFWFLSSAGDLTWNLIASTSTVPLPPAVWLFASGLIGLGLIGRRRQTSLGTAA